MRFGNGLFPDGRQVVEELSVIHHEGPVPFDFGPEYVARSLVRSIVPLPLAVCHERLSFPWNHLAAVAVSQAYTLGEDL
jgi:hypothetical protein